MASSDQVFLRAFRWLKGAVTALETDLTGSGQGTLATPLCNALRTRLGLKLDQTEATIDPGGFAATNADAKSLAVATMVAGETLAALRTLSGVLESLTNHQVPDLTELAAVVGQIERIATADAEQPPSAYSLAKLLLILSGDADAPAADPPARRLVYLLRGLDPTGNALTAAEVQTAQMVLGLVVIVIGSIIDRAFAASNLSDALGWKPPAGPAIPLPALLGNTTYSLARADAPGKQLGLRLGMDLPQTLYVELSSSLATREDLPSDFALSLEAAGSLKLQLDLPALTVPLPALTPPTLTGASALGIHFSRTKALVLGDPSKTHFQIGEISGGLTLKLLEPLAELDLKDGKLVLDVAGDPFLGAVIGGKLEVDLAFGLIADRAGGLRLKDGTGLKTTIPLQKIPYSPVQVPFLTFEVRVDGDDNHIDVELSGSFKVEIGPFSGSIDRLGTLLPLTGMLPKPGLPSLPSLPGLSLKPPSGIGLAIDTGVIKGGGFLLFDFDRGEYGGILDVRLSGIGVKAIGLLSTKNPAGWSLLLVIAANLPPIQLGYGFTLTGIGGLIGVQHTVSIDTLSAGLASGSLDSFLFPQNPVANAPQIINQLRSIFPFKAGGFVTGPMLELGWATPSLVTARVGVLIEASQIVFVGQVIVQLPPLVSSSLAILRLQVDFAGGIVFDPFKVWFDGLLRDSRVVFVSLTGQFAFRAIFGDEPSFLISAGGFHPRFTDLPPGLPSPFQRVGADLSIGICGLQFKGYFAVTSASVQGGAMLRVWADVGIASFEGGFEFNAIVYIVPRFRFEVDLHVWAGVEVFGIDFASVDLYGLFAGPGRWHIVGRAEVHTPWPLPDFSFSVDESWGEELDTPVRLLRLAEELKTELEKPGNWAAVLPPRGEGAVTFAALPAKAGVLAHPNATLQFVQKRMPLAKALDKLGSDGIEGEHQVAIDQLTFGSVLKKPDRHLEQNFAAGQFFDLSEDQVFAKPSFEPFEAGFEVGQRTWQYGTPALDVYDYEEVNLSTPGAPSGLALGALTHPGLAAWAGALGAAGRSERRLAERLRPALDRRIKVNPPPLATIDRDAGTLTGTRLGGLASRSYWTALDQARAGGAALEVVEACETFAAF